MSETQLYETTIPDSMAGQRLDQVLAELFCDFSRSRLAQWVKQGQVRVDGAQWRPRDKVFGGERVVLTAELEQTVAVEPEPIPLDILYEDSELIVLNKPAGLVVHPGAGNAGGTLQNALLHHAPELVEVPRAGIVHRLDKETSGLLMVARTLSAHKSLVDQLQERSVTREYDAVTVGRMVGGGVVDEPIGRHRSDRTKMAVSFSGKPAVTHYRVQERFPSHTHIRVRLETGRTHQIRVHMAHIHYPLVGDQVYGGRLRIPKGTGEALAETLRGFRRQALHARRLGIAHPAGGEYLEWEQEPPADFLALLEALRRDAELHDEYE